MRTYNDDGLGVTTGLTDTGFEPSTTTQLADVSIWIRSIICERIRDREVWLRYQNGVGRVSDWYLNNIKVVSEYHWNGIFIFILCFCTTNCLGINHYNNGAEMVS